MQRIAIDSGGTFTDAVYVADGRLRILKVPSTPRNPADAIVRILERVIADHYQKVAPQRVRQGKRAAGDGRLELLHGTTVGTNALLQRRGGRVALVTTAGFEDVLEIGRQARPRLYDWFVERPAPLVPSERRIGLRERMGPGGRVLLRPSRSELTRMVRAARASRAEAVAVCFLFSYANPAHERAAGAALAAAGIRATLSCDVLPEFREFERTATTAVNAYLIPVMGKYLGEASARAAKTWGAGGPRGTRVQVMQSNGGIVSAEAAAREPVRTLLSGPAGGVLGAEYVAGTAGYSHVISFDMGGTSTDVALLAGHEASGRTTNEAEVAGLPVAVPVLDIHTVGAGGGSLARFDRAGALRVGPESAGADPGPACYGRGERPTVTDAQLVLGRISADGFLGGEFPLDAPRARRALEAVLRAAPAGPRTAEEFAQGIVDVANAVMEKAIRVISIERGHDPRDYTLVAFGGAGGLHACELAAALRLPRVLVPRLPGGLSALGILRADVVKEYVRTVQLAALPHEEMRRRLAAAFAGVERAGARELAREGFRGPAQLRVERFLDCRYAGQGYELTIPAAGGFAAAFHRTHQQRYGHSDASRTVEVVNVRARMAGLTPKPGLARSPRGGASATAARSGKRRLFVDGRWMEAAFYDRARLRAGNRLRGPAVVSEYGATSFLPPGWRGRLDAFGNLLLEPEKK
ncbi:MAG TPA: hydantoinase/oxoprolinase family protein [Candidatus Acidoferrales bacterium]|nr:hydantoinase/oxoprolinase family protein [Candidatus Acidoferrales bacterium]